MVNKYNCSEDLKKAMVTKLFQPGGPSVLELCKKQGLFKTTIYNWIKKYGVLGDNSIMAANTTINKSSSDYKSASSKLKAIIDTENLAEEEMVHIVDKKPYINLNFKYGNKHLLIVLTHLILKRRIKSIVKNISI